jgi:hypothetical protein
MKTDIGNRNVVVQHGAGKSETIWLEVELSPDHGVPGTTCLALTPTEAMWIGEWLKDHADRVFDEHIAAAQARGG